MKSKIVRFESPPGKADDTESSTFVLEILDLDNKPGHQEFGGSTIFRFLATGLGRVLSLARQ